MAALSRGIRRSAAVAAYVLAAGWGVLSAIGRDESLVQWANLLGLSVVCTIWCAADATARGRALVWPARIGIFLFWPLGVPVYVVRSRGPRGLITAAVAGLSWLALMFAVFTVSELIAWRDPIPQAERAVLEAAETMEVFRLDPMMGTQEHKIDRAVGFHGYPVLRRAQVKDANTRAEIAAAVVRGWRQNDKPRLCFDPRHGIRVTRGGQTADFVICYECKQVKVYSATDSAGSFETGDAGHELLDRVLKDGVVPENPKARP